MFERDKPIYSKNIIAKPQPRMPHSINISLTMAVGFAI